MCSQCHEEFATGYEYRLHWEEKHFYPYVKKNSFDYESAKKDLKRDYFKYGINYARKKAEKIKGYPLIISGST